MVRPVPPVQEVVQRIREMQRPLPPGASLGIALSALAAVAAITEPDPMAAYSPASGQDEIA